MTFDLGAFASGAGGVVGGVAVLWTSINALRREVKELREVRMKAVEGGLAEIRASCADKHKGVNDDAKLLSSVKSTMEMVQDSVERLETKVDAAREDIARAAEKATNNDGFIRDVRTELRTHKDNVHVHGGRSDS